MTDVVYLLIMSAIFVIYGGGKLSADQLISDIVEPRWGEDSRRGAAALEGLPRVVIVGAGFGGLSCAAALRSAVPRSH